MYCSFPHFPEPEQSLRSLDLFSSSTSLLLTTHPPLPSCKLVLRRVTPWIAAHQAPLSMDFSRQGYWSKLPFLSPGDLLNPRIKPISCILHWQADSLLLSHQGSQVLLSNRKEPSNDTCHNLDGLC